MGVILHTVIPNADAVVINYECNLSEADDPFFETGRAYADYLAFIARCDALG